MSKKVVILPCIADTEKKEDVIRAFSLFGYHRLSVEDIILSILAPFHLADRNEIKGDEVLSGFIRFTQEYMGSDVLIDLVIGEIKLHLARDVAVLVDDVDAVYYAPILSACNGTLFSSVKTDKTTTESVFEFIEEKDCYGTSESFMALRLLHATDVNGFKFDDVDNLSHHIVDRDHIEWVRRAGRVGFSLFLGRHSGFKDELTLNERKLLIFNEEDPISFPGLDEANHYALSVEPLSLYFSSLFGRALLETPELMMTSAPAVAPTQ